jgi:crotonobetaine/carnitine-CoA ligase
MGERVYEEMRLVLPDRATWTLPWVLRNAAETHGDRIYMDVPDHGRRLTFSDTYAGAFALAQGLIGAGGEPADRLLIMAPNRAEIVLCWYGAGLAGMVEVPINTAYHGAFLEHQVRSTSPRIAIIAAEFAERFVSGDQSAYGSVERYYILGDTGEQASGLAVLHAAGKVALPFDELARPDGEAGLPDVTPRDAAAIFFTSGTTGLSKGVTMSNSHMTFFAQQLISLTRMTPADIQMSCGPLFHGNAQFLAAYPCLIAGARFVLREKYSASRWIDQIRDSGATIANFVGVMMDWTYKQPERDDDAENNLRCIYTVPTPTSILPDFSRRFGVDVYVENYGMTEISMPILSPYGQERPPGAAGLLVDEFFEVRIVDPETDEDVPEGEVGEFVVRPRIPWIILTDYFNMPDRTADAMRNLWFHSGDGVRRDANGWYYFVDRLKDTIRRRGENISSYELEQAVLSHPRIAACAAVAAPAKALAGEDEVALFAVVDPRQPLTVEDVRAWCAEALPAFAVPEYITLVDELPQTPSGKVQKTVLRKLAAERAQSAAGA